MDPAGCTARILRIRVRNRQTARKRRFLQSFVLLFWPRFHSLHAPLPGKERGGRKSHLPARLSMIPTVFERMTKSRDTDRFLI